MSRFIIALVGLLAFAGLAAADPLTLASSYQVSGTNPNGSRYSGTVDVDVISSTTFTLRWHIGNSTIRGFGMRMGDMLSGTYVLNGEPGLVMYRVLEGGELDGTWAIRGQSGSGTERLTPR